ncbi:MAG: hypothetical protein WBH98_06630 [Bacteroidales bacterium]
MKTKFTLLITLALLLLFNFSKAQCVLEIKQPAQLTAAIQGENQSVCSGTEVTFNINFSGGTQPWKLYIDGTLIDGNITSSPYQYTTTLTSTTTFSGDPTAGSNINVAIKDGKNCDGTVTGSITFTVHPLPANPTGEATQFFCATTPAPTVANLVATGDNIQWFATADPTAQALLPTQTLATGSTYYAYSFSGTSPNCPSAEPLAVTVTITPVITIPTIADQTICSGSGATLEAIPGGGNGTGTYSYQWKVEESAGVWGNAPGASTNATYETGNLSTTTKYKVEVESGACTNESNEITVNVVPVITIAAVTGETSICTGTTTVLSVDGQVSGGGGTYNYQWQEYDGSNWIPVTGGTGATTHTYTTASLTADKQFQVKVTSTAATGCDEATSNTVTVTVYPAVTIAAVTGETSICTGTTTVLSVDGQVSGGGGTYNYQWQEYDGSNWVAVTGGTGATTHTYTTDPLTADKQFKVKVTSTAATGCGDVFSDPVTVTVYDAVAIATEPERQNVCSGSTATLSVTASGGGGTYTYQWQKQNKTTLNWEDIDGATSNSYTTPVLTADPGTVADTSYRVIVSSSSATGCDPATSKVVVVSTSGGPQSTFTLKDVSCYGGNDGEIKVTVTAGIPNFTLNLYEGETTAGTLLETGSINSVTHPNNTFTFTGLTAKKYTVSVKDAYGCDQKQCPTP